MSWPSLPSARTVADRIELRGLRVSALCGALPEERVRAQPFEVDLDLDVDLAPAGATDDLDDTVDYGAVCAAVEAAMLGEQFTLMEAMAQRVADVVLAHAGVTVVDVTVRKLRPPVPQQLETSGVRIRRSASG